MSHTFARAGNSNECLLVAMLSALCARLLYSRARFCACCHGIGGCFVSSATTHRCSCPTLTCVVAGGGQGSSNCVSCSVAELHICA